MTDQQTTMQKANTTVPPCVGEMALSRMLLVPALLTGLGACANIDPAPIDYKAPVEAEARARASTLRREIVVPVADPASVSSMPAVQEAAALSPKTATRPGGPMLQPKDDPETRKIRVAPGERLYDISRTYSVNMRALIETNKLVAPYELGAGQTLVLPPPNIHRVEPGETLYSVSRRYNVDTRSLAVMNRLQRPWTVWPQDELLLPPLARDLWREPLGVSGEAAALTGKTATKASSRPKASSKANEGPISLKPGSVRGRTANAASTSPPVSSAEMGFRWPVSGRVLKGFGADAAGVRNDGVNIEAQRGVDIMATAAGEVVYAGDELAGFGNLVLLQHAGGWVSAYAHADAVLVKVGQTVRQGEKIAKAGTTGSVGSPQVHFELRKGTNPVDPTLHLPPLDG